MRADGNKGQPDELFFKNKIVASEKNNKAKCRITAAAGSIPKGLKGHNPPERRVKEI